MAIAMTRPMTRHSNRQWFVDRRAPDRRLQVTWHGEQRTAVLSIWHADTCAATFQLPTADAAGLIAHLADGLAEMATLPPRPPEARPAEGRTALSSRIVATMQRSLSKLRHS
jgi:hypothetical protein